MEVLLRLEQLAQGFLGGVPDPVMQSLAGVLRDRGQAIPGRANEVFFPGATKVL